MARRRSQEKRKKETPARAAVAAGGAADFYRHKTRPDFLDVTYASAPPRIQAALEDEVRFLRGVLNGSGRALELGCGNGRLLVALGGCARRWVGVDFLASYLRDTRGRRRLARGTALVAGHAAQLPFASGVFDDVVCGQSTLGLLGDQKRAALREAVRVIRPGGRLVFVVYSERSVVPRAEWYLEMHRRGLMALLDWSRSSMELLVTEDGHASECFGRRSLEELFRGVCVEPRIERLGDIYWTIQAQPDSLREGKGNEILQ